MLILAIFFINVYGHKLLKIVKKVFNAHAPLAPKKIEFLIFFSLNLNLYCPKVL